MLRDTTINAKRGTIYDTNGKVLAESASAWQVVLSPINFKDDKQREAAASGLSEILGVDYQNVLEKTQQKSYYVVVKRKIEVEARDQVMALMDKLSKEYDCDGEYIWFNSVRSGLMQAWRMKSDGSEQTQMTFDEGWNTWFPHISPDRQKVVMLAYKKGDVKPNEHLPHRHVELRFMNADGTRHTGWLKRGNKKFYFDSNGVMTAKQRFVKIGKKVYYVRSDGSMKTGWLKVNGKFYYMDADGSRHTGWLEKGQRKFYFGSDGVLRAS